MLFLVQLPKFKVILIAACFLIVESIEAHVRLLHFLGSIVEWSGGVLLSRYCRYHFWSENGAIRAFDTLRLYLKCLAHGYNVFSRIITAVLPAMSFKC